MGLNPKALTMRLPKGLKRFDDNSVHYIYASHLLEHLEYPKVAQDFVAECHRILTPEGVLRIVVPGIEKIIRAYVRNDQEFFEIQATLHPMWCTTKLEHLMYAIQQDGEHKYGYDFDTIKKLISKCSFRKIIKSDFNKSQVEELRIDYRSITDNIGGYLSLYVDAFK
jgi:predicted SAM-dependent methyltransferase